MRGARREVARAGRRVRRALVAVVVAALASVGFVGIAAAPAGADAFGYTIEVQLPRGFNGFLGYPCRLAQVDLATGAVTGIGSFQPPTSLACAHDLAFSPDGGLYGISFGFGEEDEVGNDGVEPGGDFDATESPAFVHLVRFDTTTGAVTDLGVIGTDPAFIGYVDRPGGGLTFDAAGNLWVLMVGEDPNCNREAFCLYKVDPANPADAQFIGAGPEEIYLYGLTVNCAGQAFSAEQDPELFGVAADVLVAYGGNYLLGLDPGTGTVGRVGSGFGGNHLVQSLDFGADGVLYGIGSQYAAQNKGFLATGYLYTVSPAAGTATQGAKLSAPEVGLAQALAVAPLDCSTPSPLVVTPRFTG